MTSSYKTFLQNLQHNYQQSYSAALYIKYSIFKKIYLKYTQTVV